MSDPSPAPSGDLQFDKAEPAHGQSVSACAACRKPLANVYYQVNGHPVCERCKAQLEFDRMSGSVPGNVVRAAAFGFVAALGGGALWYAVRAATGYEVGLIAVLVGVMVGKAVRAGSRSRGGVAYQVLAVALTYFGICVQYVPDIIKAIRDQQTTRAHTTATASSTTAAPATTEPPASLTSPPPAATHSPGVQLLMAVGLLLAFAMAAPFLGGVQNIIGLLIIGFALWEAWKINRRVRLHIEGPFSLAPAPPKAG